MPYALLPVSYAIQLYIYTVCDLVILQGGYLQMRLERTYGNIHKGTGTKLVLNILTTLGVGVGQGKIASVSLHYSAAGQPVPPAGLCTHAPLSG